MSIKVITSTINTLTANPTPFHEDKKISNVALKTMDGTTNHWLTQGNLERTGWSALSLVSGAGSIASYLFYTIITLSTGSIIASLLPPALIAAAGALAFKAYSTPDYDNTAEVAQYRKAAETAPLKETLIKHGKWTYDRKILSQEQVEKKYLEKESSLQGLILKLSYYNEIQDLLHSPNISSYTLPGYDRLIKEIQKECKAQSIQEIKDLHSLELLFLYQLLTPEEFFIKYEKHAKDLFDQKGLTAVFADYKTTFENHKTLLKTAKQRAAELQDDALKAFEKKPEVIEKILDYEIPHPITFKKLWLQKNPSFEQMIKEDYITDLFNFGFFRCNSDSIISITSLTRRFIANEEAFAKNKALIQSDFDQEIKEAKRLYDKEISIAKYTLMPTLSPNFQKNIKILSLEKEIHTTKQKNNPSDVDSLKATLESVKTEKFNPLNLTKTTTALAEREFSILTFYNEKIINIASEKQKALSIKEDDYKLEKKLIENAYKTLKKELL